uniref:acylphosphatase-2-like isoform X1 n=1 Tax=Monopterus albus TaxID=43700 RepID=UPI0009B3ADE7|nr:acylphosphatase-2-like isoform X1 [Monopterus albus]
MLLQKQRITRFLFFCCGLEAPADVRVPWCFAEYTEREGLRLGLVGWVKNTYGGTVVGQVQGPADMVEEMKVWLSKEGSPGSRITRASFKNQRSIDKLELSGFKTRF